MIKDISDEIYTAIEFHQKITFICSDPARTVIGLIHYLNDVDESFHVVNENDGFEKIPFNIIICMEVL